MIPPRAAARILWDLDRNVPVVGHAGPGRVSRVKLTSPADARPMLGEDYRITAEAIIHELGDPALLRLLLPEDEVILLNKIPYPDAGDEVIVQGRIVGHRFYDPALGRWRFKPLYEGVARMIDARRGYYAIVDLPKLAPRFTVHRDAIREAELPPKKGMFVAVSTRDGRYHAVARLVRGRRLLILKAWRGQEPRYLSRPSSIHDMIEANRDRLERLLARSEIIIEDALERRRAPLVVSFSGGKDSLVALHLGVKAGAETMVFADTGLELPETYDAVEEAADKLGVELLVASAGDAFWRSLRRLGPPARDYRWCCRICKLAPLARLYKRAIGRTTLTITGQRRLESAERARMPPLARSRWIPDTLVVAPLNDWTALDVWMYIFQEGLPVNRAYWLGFDRVGCWLCPACELAEFEQVRIHHPELWGPWEEKLRSWARSAGFPPEWVDLGGWRWRRLPGDYKRLLVQEFAIDPGTFERPRIPMKAEREADKVVLHLGAEPERGVLDTLLRIAGLEPVETEDGALSVELPGGLAQVSGDKLEVLGSPHIDSLRRVLAAVSRAIMCVGCGLCETVCPEGAALPGPRVDESRCTACGRCMRACPAARWGAEELARLIEGLLPRPEGEKAVRHAPQGS